MIGLEKSRGGKTNRRVSLQTSCFPIVSHALRCLTSCFVATLNVKTTLNVKKSYTKGKFLH